jgi:hypothetical protein
LTFFPNSTTYYEFPLEGILVNTLAMVLVALAILLSYAVRRELPIGSSLKVADLN